MGSAPSVRRSTSRRCRLRSRSSPISTATDARIWYRRRRAVPWSEPGARVPEHVRSAAGRPGDDARGAGRSDRRGNDVHLHRPGHEQRSESRDRRAARVTVLGFGEIQSIGGSPGCAAWSATVTCELGALASGARAVTVVVRALSGGTPAGAAGVTATTSDPNPSNNSAFTKRRSRQARARSS